MHIPVRLATCSRTAVATIAALSAVLVTAPARLATAASTPPGTTRGTPWIGPHGVTETVGHIMARHRPPAAAAQAAHPPLPRPTPKQSAGASRASSSGARAAAPATPRAPQTVTTNFLGGTLNDSNFIPPDSMGAAGPSQFIVTVNGLIRSFTRSGAADGALNTSTNNFFASVLGSGLDTTDPRIRYDRLSGRWFITMITDNPNVQNQPVNDLLLAVSSGGTITSASSFTFFAVQQDQITPAGNDAGCLLDYDSLAVDVHALYVGGDFFCGNTFQDAGVFVIRKSSVLGTGPMVATAFRNLTNGVSSGPFAPQGADNDNPAATNGYVIGADVAIESDLKLRRITDPGGTPSISGNIDIPVATTAVPAPVPHEGSLGNPLDAVDDRLMNAVVRNGQIWTAHAILVDRTGAGNAAGDRDGTRWYEIGGIDSTPAVTQFNTVFDGAATNPLSWWMPSINVSPEGDMALGGSVAGAAHFADAWTAGTLPADGSFTETPTVYTASSSAYNVAEANATVDRWGDFSFTSVDPNDGMTMWTIQEYTPSTDVWGVQVAKLMAPPPAIPQVVTPTAGIPAGLPSVNVRLDGNPVSGAAFFDPGSGFANRIHGAVTGGVVVNSIRVDSPTSLVLNLNTVGASTGAQNVTITNPDGQSATGTGILHVTPAEGLLRVTTNPALPSQLGVNGTPRDSWGLTWLSLPAASYNVSASHVEGWTEPAAQPATVTAGSTTTVQENFAQRGELRVITSPAVPAPISVDGTPRDDWGVFTDLPTGSHQVCFGPTAGFDPPTPACQMVTLTAGQQTTLTGTYTSDANASGPQGTGLLRVTTNPALPSQIMVDGVVMDSWGLTWVDLAPGQHTVSFTHVEGWTEPSPQVVTVTAGQTTTLQGNFVQRGELHVVTSPAVPATITMDGVPLNNWGVFTDVPAGAHTICFGWAPGSVAPSCQTLPVSAGGTTTVTGTYTAGP